jgi:Mrp family chromosome partitioning ATPase
MDGTIMRGEVVGAEFMPSDVDDGRIVIRVAVDGDYRVAHRNVVMVDADLYDAALPTVADIEGIAGGLPDG